MGGPGARIWTAAGVGVTVFAVALANHALWSHTGLPLLLTPIGASALLLFSKPDDPSARFWPVVGGVAISALAGVVAARLMTPFWACPSAALLALTTMWALRCLHPAGIAVALTAVVGGPAIRAEGFAFLWRPVIVDWLIVYAMFALFRRLASRFNDSPMVMARQREVGA
ncbi:MAG: hypothetical protein JWO72_756 [Caulobacteraceae bacterium]|nr:hypothetical protein [Caulobacteraceae bacterium]